MTRRPRATGSPAWFALWFVLAVGTAYAVGVAGPAWAAADTVPGFVIGVVIALAWAAVLAAVMPTPTPTD